MFRFSSIRLNTNLSTSLSKITRYKMVHMAPNARLFRTSTRYHTNEIKTLNTCDEENKLREIEAEIMIKNLKEEHQKKYQKEYPKSQLLIMIGAAFNKMYPEHKWYKSIKVINNKLQNYNLEFNPIGITKDTLSFDPDPNCKPGGIYFTDGDNIEQYTRIRNPHSLSARAVLFNIRIPSHAIVSILLDEKGRFSKAKATEIDIIKKVTYSEDPRTLDSIIAAEINIQNYVIYITQSFPNRTSTCEKIIDYMSYLQHYCNYDGPLLEVIALIEKMDKSNIVHE